MTRGPASAIVVIVVLVAGAALGRVASLGVASVPFKQCMSQALSRRMDPVEARHTCTVIAANL